MGTTSLRPAGRRTPAQGPRPQRRSGVPAGCRGTAGWRAQRGPDRLTPLRGAGASTSGQEPRGRRAGLGCRAGSGAGAERGPGALHRGFGGPGPLTASPLLSGKATARGRRAADGLRQTSAVGARGAPPSGAAARSPASGAQRDPQQPRPVPSRPCGKLSLAAEPPAPASRFLPRRR